MGLWLKTLFCNISLFEFRYSQLQTSSIRRSFVRSWVSHSTAALGEQPKKKILEWLSNRIYNKLLRSKAWRIDSYYHILLITMLLNTSLLLNDSTQTWPYFAWKLFHITARINQRQLRRFLLIISLIGVRTTGRITEENIDDRLWRLTKGWKIIKWQHFLNYMVLGAELGWHHLRLEVLWPMLQNRFSIKSENKFSY